MYYDDSDNYDDDKSDHINDETIINDDDYDDDNCDNEVKIMLMIMMMVINVLPLAVVITKFC